MNRRMRYRKGAASFYIVAFSTLILMIVAISFAAVIISEVERTSNDDLSQSAYDSALAGVEDAKLAYYNYQNCKLNEGSSGDCANIIGLMEKEWKDTEIEEECNMVWNILGRDANTIADAVVESNVGNNMQQYATCVTMTDVLPDYRGSLSVSSPVDVVKAKFEQEDAVGKIDRVKISWYSADDASRDGVSYGNYVNNKVVFPSFSAKVSAPPTISFTMLQTGPTFDLASFSKVGNNETNRGMLYLVPSQNGGSGANSGYISANNNTIESAALVKSNDKTVENLPYVVDCADSVEQVEGYACSVNIKLPNPVGDARNKDTFRFVISLPYGQPTTDFSLEFYCDNQVCGDTVVNQDLSGNTETESLPANLKGVQLDVDSTGRANDLYRRVDVRLKNQNDSFSVIGPLELIGNSATNPGMSKDFDKNDPVTCEYEPAFGGPTC